MHNVVIIGAGGHACVVADIVIKNGDKVLGFLDDNKQGKIFGDYNILGKVSDVMNFSEDVKFIIAIGNNGVRKKISQQYDLNWYTAIHPSAQIGTNVEIGEGSCVMPNAVINCNSVIGNHCIVNTSSVVEHDNKLGNYVHISPSAVLCGTVCLGDEIQIGANATVINNINICSNTLVGAGAAVVKNITESGVYVGVPAKKL